MNIYALYNIPLAVNECERERERVPCWLDLNVLTDCERQAAAYFRDSNRRIPKLGFLVSVFIP